MDLQSGALYWPSTCRRPRLGRGVGGPLAVDALVIGAGVTGALVAYELTRAGAAVAVVDSRRPGKGSTPASTALLQYEIDTSLVELGSLVGVRSARHAYRVSHEALGGIARTVRELGVDVELEHRQSLQLAVTREHAKKFRGEAAARASIGIGARALDEGQLRKRFGFLRPGAMLNADAMEINPLKLTFALLTAACAGGAVLLRRARLDLSTIGSEGGPFEVASGPNFRVRARHLVVATGYETPEQFREVSRLTELRSTFAVATGRLKGEPWPGRALLWEAGDPYFYARTCADGRVLAGGEDEAFTTARERDARIDAKSRVLMGKLRDLVPGMRARAMFRWAGTFAQTADGLPYIGEHPRWPDVHFALGYGGNGITFSSIAAKIIAGTICGRRHRAAGVFGFERAGVT